MTLTPDERAAKAIYETARRRENRERRQRIKADRAPEKWAYARQIASLLSSTGLTGPSMTLPVTYGWMMGFPPGWLALALRSAVQGGRLRQVSSSKPSATRSSPRSPKRSAARSSE